MRRCVRCLVLEPRHHWTIDRRACHAYLAPAPPAQRLLDRLLPPYRQHRN